MLHAFYDPDDCDSCLAAWAVQHALGEAVALHSGEITYHLDMLVLNRHGHFDNPDGPLANILLLCAAPVNWVTTGANVTLVEKTRWQPCCLSAWQNFHVSNPPAFIDHLDKTYNSNHSDDSAFSALLGIPWTI